MIRFLRSLPYRCTCRDNAVHVFGDEVRSIGTLRVREIHGCVLAERLVGVLRTDRGKVSTCTLPILTRFCTVIEYRSGSRNIGRSIILETRAIEIQSTLDITRRLY